MLRKREWIRSAIGATLFLMAGGAHSGETRPPTAGGPLSQLPGGTSAATRPETLQGYQWLLAKSLEQAIDEIRHGELQAFARSLKNTVDVHNTFADAAGSAAEALGDALTRVEHAQRMFDLPADQGAGDDGPRREAVRKSIEDMRSLLVTKLSADRDAYQRLPADNSGQQAAALRRMQGTVAAVRHLDQVHAAMSVGAQPLVPGQTVAQVRQRLEAFRTALEEEQQALAVVTEATGLMVDDTLREMQQSLQLFAVEATLPAEQLEQLGQVRQLLTSSLADVMDAYNRARDSAQKVWESTGQAVPADPEQLLREVDRLVGGGNQDATR